jgi:starch synthase
VVSRLVYQKGLDLTLGVADYIVEQGGQIAIIGRGEPEEEQAMRELALRHPGRIGVRIGFNETDARRMFAGSDFLLMPSRYEPCGLSQMYAQRFGSLPVARNTGGLADTIENGVTGFLFNDSTGELPRSAEPRLLCVRQEAPAQRHALPVDDPAVQLVPGGGTLRAAVRGPGQADPDRPLLSGERTMHRHGAQ